MISLNPVTIRKSRAMADSAAGWKAGLCLLSRRGARQALRWPGCRCGPEAGPAHSMPVEVPGKFCLLLISSSGLGANTNADRLDGHAVLPSVPLSLPHPGVAAAVKSMHWRLHCPLSSDSAPGPTDGGLTCRWPSSITTRSPKGSVCPKDSMQ